MRKELVLINQYIFAAFDENRASLVHLMIFGQDKVGLVIVKEILADRDVLIRKWSFVPVLQLLKFLFVFLFFKQKGI
jgi:hypothetical protein